MRQTGFPALTKAWDVWDIALRCQPQHSLLSLFLGLVAHASTHCQPNSAWVIGCTSQPVGLLPTYVAVMLNQLRLWWLLCTFLSRDISSLLWMDCAGCYSGSLWAPRSCVCKNVPTTLAADLWLLLRWPTWCYRVTWFWFCFPVILLFVCSWWMAA